MIFIIISIIIIIFLLLLFYIIIIIIIFIIIIIKIIFIFNIIIIIIIIFIIINITQTRDRNVFCNTQSMLPQSQHFIQFAAISTVFFSVPSWIAKIVFIIAHPWIMFCLHPPIAIDYDLNANAIRDQLYM